VNWDFMPAVVERALARFDPRRLDQDRLGGLYEDTPTASDPERSTARGFINAAGFSGHGVMHAPVTGQLISELIVDGRTSLEHQRAGVSRSGPVNSSRAHTSYDGGAPVARAGSVLGRRRGDFLLLVIIVAAVSPRTSVSLLLIVLAAALWYTSIPKRASAPVKAG